MECLPDLRAQVGRTDEGMDEAGHEVLEREGVEVDDVAHRSARVALHRSSEVVHDLEQRVSKRVRKRMRRKLTSTNWPLRYGFFMYGVERKTSMKVMSSSCEFSAST